MKTKKIKDKINSESDSANLLEKKSMALPHQSMEEFGAIALERAVTQLQQVVETVSKNPTINRKDALIALERLVEITKAEIDGLTPSIPAEAPKLWKERGRKNRFASPFKWIRDNYVSYGYGLTVNDLGRLDPTLHQAVLKARSTRNVPDWVNLPTLEEANSEMLNQMTSDERKSIVRLGNLIQQRQKRKRNRK